MTSIIVNCCLIAIALVGVRLLAGFTVLRLYGTDISVGSHLCEECSYKELQSGDVITLLDEDTVDPSHRRRRTR